MTAVMVLVLRRTPFNCTPSITSVINMCKTVPKTYLKLVASLSLFLRSQGPELFSSEQSSSPIQYLMIYSRSPPSVVDATSDESNRHQVPYDWVEDRPDRPEPGAKAETFVART